MLKIEISRSGFSGLDYTELTQFNIPQPPNGFRPEVNNNVVMLFEDEQEAIDYAHLVDSYAESLNDQETPEYLATSDIIKAIGEDEFVQSYILS